MIDYGPDPSNQSRLDLPGVQDDGAELMKSARKFAAMNYAAFQRYKRIARYQMAESTDGKASPNGCKEQMRNGFDVERGELTHDTRRCISVPNAYAPCLARIAMEQDKSLKFRTAASKSDGFTTAAL